MSAQSVEVLDEHLRKLLGRFYDACVESFQLIAIQYSKGTSWTTDAPYRKTIEELRQYCSDDVATVEMEASALFAVGAYRGISVSAMLVISDILSEEDWDQGYHSEEKLEGLKQIFEIALETIAINNSNNQKSGK